VPISNRLNVYNFFSSQTGGHPIFFLSREKVTVRKIFFKTAS
jgi:hypothetical protein